MNTGELLLAILAYAVAFYSHTYTCFYRLLLQLLPINITVPIHSMNAGIRGFLDAAPTLRNLILDSVKNTKLNVCFICLTFRFPNQPIPPVPKCLEPVNYKMGVSF